MQDVRTREVRERVHSDAQVGAAVNGYRHPQALGFRVDRPVALVAQMERQSRGRKHPADEAQLVHRPPELLHGLRHVLHGQERHRPQPVAHLGELLVDVVVVGLADLDRIPRYLDEAYRKPFGGEQDGLVDAGLLEKGDPVLAAARHILAGGDPLAAYGPRPQGEMHSVNGRENALTISGRIEGLALDAVTHELGHVGDPLHDMAVTIHYGVIVIRHGILPNCSRNPHPALLLRHPDHTIAGLTA